jgi:hypothetical protein
LNDYVTGALHDANQAWGSYLAQMRFPLKWRQLVSNRLAARCHHTYEYSLKALVLSLGFVMD